MSYFGSQTDLSVVQARIGIFHYLHFSGIVVVIIIVSDHVCSSFAVRVVLVTVVVTDKSQGVICAPRWSNPNTSTANSNTH